MKNLITRCFIICILLNITSINSNAQWVPTQLNNVDVGRFLFDGTTLYAACNYSGMSLSKNNGINWTWANSGFSAFCAEDLAVSYSSSDTSVFVATYGGVYRSTNHGANWMRVDNGFTHNDVYAIIAVPNGIGGTSIFAGTPNGIFRSTNNGTNWVMTNNGLPSTSLWVTTFTNVGTNVYAGMFEGGGVFLSTNNGDSWTAVNNGISNPYIKVLANIGTNIFAGTANGMSDGRVIMSTNYGNSWTTISNNLPPLWIFALTGFGPNLFIGTAHGIFLTTNLGGNWTNISDTLSNPWVFSLKIMGQNILAGTSGRGVWWRPLNELITPVELASFTAAAHDNNITLQWQTATEKNNQGYDIQRKSAGTEWVSIAFISGAGTSTETHFYNYQDNNLRYGSYIYRLKQIDYDGTISYSKEVNSEVLEPDKYILSQNYPNPFNPSTQIEYAIAKAGLVTLKVYNSLGEEVQTLVNEVKEPGKYKIQFNTTSLSSGVYLYKLTSGDFVQTRKMTMLK